MPGTRCCRSARARRRPRGLWTAASFGEPLPERVTRAIVLARLANLVDGHAGARPALALAVAAMLDGGPLPAVPARGNGGSGEILALGHLFGELAERARPRAAREDGADQRIAVRRRARGGRGAGRARTARARRAHVRALGRGDPRAARRVRRRARGPVGRRARGGCARLAGHAAGGRCARAPGASGPGEPSRPAARARPRPRGAGARRAHRGRLARLRDRQPGLPPAGRRPPGAP